MNNQKVKDYTRMGGWLLLITILCATRSISSLLSWLTNWQTNAMIWLPLPFLGMLSAGMALTSFILIIMRNRAARYLFAIGTAAELILGVAMIAILDSWGIGGAYRAQLVGVVLQQLAFCVAGSIYLFRSRRVAVYFGEVQPMWYECGQAAPCGAQPPAAGVAMPGAVQQPGTCGVQPYEPSQQAGEAQPAASPAPIPAQPDVYQSANECARHPAATGAQQYGEPSQQPMNMAQPSVRAPQAQPWGQSGQVPVPQPAEQSRPVCPACGMQGAPGTSFCTVCGARLVQPATQQEELTNGQK